MTTVAIVCEYNPFHNGHKYHIDRIREDFGPDTTVIAVMSGNFTQRGECAIADKGLRAKCAVLGGANLVLELPFPFSAASAELFASAAVSIIDSLGTVDYISFGSEAGELEPLLRVASAMQTEEYERAVARLSDDPTLRSLGYPAICAEALSSLGESELDFTPNNILALEYIKALSKRSSSIRLHTVKRMGAGYNDLFSPSTELQSATAIREAVLAKNISALEYTPNSTKKCILDAIADGSFPCDGERLGAAIISSLRISPSRQDVEPHDCGGGLYNRLRAKSLEANTLSGLVRLSQTKKYTAARIRRAIWFSYLGVTSSSVSEAPLYTQLLALDTRGRQGLKEIKRCGTIPVLTKPADTDALSERALIQKALSDRADSVFQLTKPTPPSGAYALKYTPFVK
ncbi:MAG: nucleotidyltransferase family protein [Clostridia bacterium]|nr:nucleotidyltransferase family protein [Clostridia bacterium]